MKASKNYTSKEFFALRSITDEAIAANKKLVYFSTNGKDIGESAWYVIYDTPTGKHITVEIWYSSGIKQTKVFRMENIHYFLRLAPDPEPDRKTLYINVFPNGEAANGEFGQNLYDSFESARRGTNVANSEQISITFDKSVEGKWTVSPDQTPVVKSKEEKPCGKTTAWGCGIISDLDAEFFNKATGFSKI
jgi:hypothetical protein